MRKECGGIRWTDFLAFHFHHRFRSQPAADPPFGATHRDGPEGVGAPLRCLPASVHADGAALVREGDWSATTDSAAPSLREIPGAVYLNLPAEPRPPRRARADNSAPPHESEAARTRPRRAVRFAPRRDAFVEER